MQARALVQSLTLHHVESCAWIWRLNLVESELRNHFIREGLLLAKEEEGFGQTLFTDKEKLCAVVAKPKHFRWQLWR